MKKFASYDTAVPYQKSRRLPPGGYIIGIISAIEKQESWGDVLEIKFDIAEGEYKNFFTEQYNTSTLDDKKYKGVYRINIPKGDGSEQDEWTLRRFKTDMLAIEASNSGYKWDWEEKSLEGKKSGAIFFEKEYDWNGKTGMFTALHSLCDIATIEKGDYEIPAPKMLKSKAAVMTEIDDDDLDLPF